MQQYLKILTDVILLGEPRNDRTGTGTVSIFDSYAKFDLREGFPAVTTKRLAWKSVVGELLWFLSGSTNLHDLRVFTFGRDEGQWTIWTPNYEDQAISMGYDNGNLGPVYGKQWRKFGGRDQILELIEGLKNNPHGRRHLVSAWNVAELDKMALPPCHYGFQCYVSNDGYLDLKWAQRSVDCFLGLPFNIASYALLTHILAKLTGFHFSSTNEPETLCASTIITCNTNPSSKITFLMFYTFYFFEIITNVLAHHLPLLSLYTCSLLY